MLIFFIFEYQIERTKLLEDFFAANSKNIEFSNKKKQLREPNRSNKNIRMIPIAKNQSLKFFY